MAIYEITSDKLEKIPETNFATERIKERDDLQRLLREQIDVLSPNTLVISEEFGEWEDSKRRVDLLGLDKSANLVVIELKRTEDGGHMELQAIRYAAMVSTLTFEKVVEIFGRFLSKMGKEEDPEGTILRSKGSDSIGRCGIERVSRCSRYIGGEWRRRIMSERDDGEYIMIDSPITPYSPLEEIHAWIEELNTFPVRPEVKEAMNEAQEILEYRKEHKL